MFWSQVSWFREVLIITTLKFALFTIHNVYLWYSLQFRLNSSRFWACWLPTDTWRYRCRILTLLVIDIFQFFRLGAKPVVLVGENGKTWNVFFSPFFLENCNCLGLIIWHMYVFQTWALYAASHQHYHDLATSFTSSPSSKVFLYKPTSRILPPPSLSLLIYAMHPPFWCSPPTPPLYFPPRPVCHTCSTLPPLHHYSARWCPLTLFFCPLL